MDLVFHTLLVLKFEYDSLLDDPNRLGTRRSHLHDDNSHCHIICHMTIWQRTLCLYLIFFFSCPEQILEPESAFKGIEWKRINFWSEIGLTGDFQCTPGPPSVPRFPQQHQHSPNDTLSCVVLQLRFCIHKFQSYGWYGNQPTGTYHWHVSTPNLISFGQVFSFYKLIKSMWVLLLVIWAGSLIFVFLLFQIQMKLFDLLTSFTISILNIKTYLIFLFIKKTRNQQPIEKEGNNQWIYKFEISGIRWLLQGTLSLDMKHLNILFQEKSLFCLHTFFSFIPALWLLFS